VNQQEAVEVAGVVARVVDEAIERRVRGLWDEVLGELCERVAELEEAAGTVTLDTATSKELIRALRERGHNMQGVVKLWRELDQ